MVATVRVRGEKTIVSAVVRMGGEEAGRALDCPLRGARRAFLLLRTAPAAERQGSRGWDHIIINFIILLSENR